MSKLAAFENTTVWSEVKDILNSKTKRFLYDYKGVLHTSKEDIAVWDLSSIEDTRDFLTEIGESKRVIFRVGLGDYVNRIYPYRRNLEFTIKKVPFGMESGNKASNVNTAMTRYKAIFNPANNPPVGMSELESHSPKDLNSTDMVEVHVELVDRSLEPLRIKTTSGAFRKVTMSTVILSILGSESNNVRVDGKPASAGIDLVPPDNTKLTANVVIPSGTTIAAIPSYLQASVGGVYNSGIGTFFQLYEGKRRWFVYPTHDSDRFNKDVGKMIFYGVPQEKLPQLDKSYKVDGRIIKVAVTAQRRYNDTAELDYMNQGSGFRMSDANAFMKKPVKITPEGPRGQRSNLNHEVVIKARDDGLNFAPNVGVGSNPYAERSKVVARSCGQIDLVWENAAPELIYPGMPCKYVYLSQGKAISLKGTILFVHSLTARVERQNASAFRTTCRITIACEPQTKIPDLPDAEPAIVGN